MFDIYIVTEYGNFGHFKDLFLFMQEEKISEIDAIYSDCFQVEPIKKHWTISQINFIMNNEE